MLLPTLAGKDMPAILEFRYLLAPTLFGYNPLDEYKRKGFLGVSQGVDQPPKTIAPCLCGSRRKESRLPPRSARRSHDVCTTHRGNLQVVATCQLAFLVYGMHSLKESLCPTVRGGVPIGGGVITVLRRAAK